MTMAQRSLLGTSPLEAYAMADGAAIAEDNIVCLDADGEAVEGSDTAGLQVAGIAARVDEDNNLVYVRDGVVELANSEVAPLTRGHRGLPAYVTGPGEVGNTSVNAICAGVVVDVYDGSVFVDVRPGYAAAAAAGAAAGAVAGAGLIAADLEDAESTIKAAATTIAGNAVAAAGNVRLVAAPAAANSTGVKGDIATDGTYLYVCTDTGIWVRASLALATWGD